MIPFAHSCGCVRGTNMKKALLHTIPAIAATLILAVQPIAAQERSEEYAEGYRDAMCDMFRELAPLLVMLAPIAVATDPESRMADITTIAEECGIEWSAVAPAPTPEPADSARCEPLAALIAPLDAEIDRLLASSTGSRTTVEIMQARSRRSDIDQEMRRAGC